MRYASVRAFSRAGHGHPHRTPRAPRIRNRARRYEKIKDRFRPGHADYT